MTKKVYRKTQRGSKRAIPHPRKPASTALVRRPRATLPQAVRPHSPVVDLNVLGEEATLGALGLVEVVLTAAEEAVLSRPVNVDHVQIKPTGQPYLSHPTYTRLFNEAFGRLGWAIVPRSKPLLNGKSVVCPYILYIHTKPAAFAMGEQEYFESNKEQTYGDALEATVASALRRCAKRLGVGLELWDRCWLNEFIETYCVKVMVQRKGDTQYLWRRRDDRPFWGEASPGQTRREPPKPEPSSGSHPKSGEKVTDPQLKRLYAIATRMGRQKSEVSMWLKVRYGLDSSKDITRADYNNICIAIEHPGPLSLEATTREPGEDDA